MIIVLLVFFTFLALAPQPFKKPWPATEPPPATETPPITPGEWENQTIIIEAEPVTVTQTKEKEVSKTVEACSFQKTCQDIDTIWSKKIGPLIRSSSEVWDTSINDWNTLSRTYSETITTEEEATTQTLPTVIYPAGSMDACLVEVKKLELAAEDMKDWSKCREGTVNDECNSFSSNTCCGMGNYYDFTGEFAEEFAENKLIELLNYNHGCCWGIPDDSTNGLKGERDVCGTYAWHVFDVAINKHKLNVNWPLGLRKTKKGIQRTRDPRDIISEKYYLWPDSWGNKEMNFPDTRINIQPTEIMPGDLIYFEMDKNLEDKYCPTKKTSHINIVGLPIKVHGETKFNIIDWACIKDKENGICKWGDNWRYPDFFYKINYCEKGDKYNQEGKADPLPAGEAWRRVIRVIPECIAAAENLGKMNGFTRYKSKI